MISISATLIVILSICSLLFIAQVNEGFSASIGGPANNVYVSWPGGVMSPPPFSVTGPSGSGYTW